MFATTSASLTMAESSILPRTSDNVKEILPSDLRKILRPIARSGRYSGLPWHPEEEKLKAKPHRNGKRKRSHQSGDTNGACSDCEESNTSLHECDSEGTSTTNSSEVRNAQVNKLGENHSQGERVESGDYSSSQTRYRSLGQAFAVAIRLVLDHSYQNHGGYKLSPAEVRAFTTNDRPPDSNAIFEERKQRLMALCNDKRQREEAPFTVQRMAEVLLAPSRYYKQTHKLCNCLEKLLLVTSSIHAFGGSVGGQTSQAKSEEIEMAALAYEKGREESENRNRRFRRRFSPSIPGYFSLDGRSTDHDPETMSKNTDEKNGKSSSLRTSDLPVGHHAHDSAEECAKAASSRNKLEQASDHEVVHDRRSFRSLSTSPPLEATSGVDTVEPQSTVASLYRKHRDYSSTHTASHDLHPFVPGTGCSDQHSFSNLETQFKASDGAVLSVPDSRHKSQQLLLMHPATMANVVLGSSPLDRQLGELNNSADKYAENENEVDRSSNSDVDSESDDFSLDDSASDRSDGSDSGTAYEPFTAARVMALNRMQQQQRLQLTRVQSLGELRPHVDVEYQSGDSMDSTMAEDSGGSDSSSSDLAD